MAKRSTTRHSLIKTLSALAVVCLFSTCASSTTDAPGNPEVTNNPGDPTASDVALLAEPEPIVNPPKAEELPQPASDVAAAPPPSTEVSDPNAFADLKEGAPEAAALTTASETTEGSQDTYDSATGGESLKRVAFTLYSDRKFAQKLLERNPELKGVAKLSAEQKVYFDIEASRPEPRFLTRDLIDRYPEKLAERLNSVSAEQGIGRSTATVAKGETLQAVSQRLYGTTRYWTELYLVNRDKIHNYNKVTAGITLNVFDRPHKAPGVAKAEAPEAAASVATSTGEDIEAPKAPAEAPLPEAVKQVEIPPAPPEVKPALPPMAALPPPPPLPQNEPLAMPMDPIPEAPPVVAEKPKPLPPPMPIAKPAASLEEIPSSDANLRRIIYVALILVIGGVAFYFTRSPKRPKLDILDMTAEGTSRPKLATKDNQKHNIG